MERKTCEHPEYHVFRQVRGGTIVECMNIDCSWFAVIPDQEVKEPFELLDKKTQDAIIRFGEHVKTGFRLQ